LAIGSALIGTAIGSARRRPKEFVRRQFSIAVFIEFLQGFGGIGDFIRIDNTVMICVQRADHRDGRMAHALMLSAARPTRARSVLRSALAIIWRILGEQQRAGPGGSSQQQQFSRNLHFQSFPFIFGLGFPHAAAPTPMRLFETYERRKI
jgi:hypothetical protein